MPLSVRPTRMALLLSSAAVIALELALMRVLSLRFWSHLAYVVISVALLGLGASGTMLTLLRRRVSARRRGWAAVLAFAFAASVPICLRAAGRLTVRVELLAWDTSSLADVLWLEGLLLVPFFLAAGLTGVALLDEPDRLGGHYAATLAGSGLGAIASVALMRVLDLSGLVLAVTAAATAAAVLLVPWRRRTAALAALAATGAVAAAAWLCPLEIRISPYKALPGLRRLPKMEVLAHREGPMGQIDVVGAPGIHHAPFLALGCLEPIPPHVLMVFDAGGGESVYEIRRRQDAAFLDYTPAAAAYHLRPRPTTLLLDAGGGAGIALARYHHSGRVVALESNPQVIELMTGPLANASGGIYLAGGVEVVPAEPRGYLAGTDRTFDVIQLPPADPPGDSGGGQGAAQESYVYTVEAVEADLSALTERGLLCITRPVRMPPRGGLRAFDIVCQALRRLGRAPAPRVAMLRGHNAVTILAGRGTLTDEDARTLRGFCEDRAFDLCYVRGMSRPDPQQQNHQLGEPYYFDAATALLGEGREAFLADYVFDVSATTDDRPFFHHFYRGKSARAIGDQLGERGRQYRELGHLLLVATLVQGGVVAAVLILLPLAPGLSAVKGARRAGATLGYFLCLGAAFMFLEMGFLQRLVLYLAHPMYAASVAICGFLVFAGAGSYLSARWRVGSRRVIGWAAGTTVALTAAYQAGLDAWLGLSQGWPLGIRFVVAAATIAPLAVAMGHMFPAALRQIAPAAPELVPWAWAVNGFASVVATIAAPLLAILMGFSRLILLAGGCYLLAGVLGTLILPGTNRPVQ